MTDSVVSKRLTTTSALHLSLILLSCATDARASQNDLKLLLDIDKNVRITLVNTTSVAVRTMLPLNVALDDEDAGIQYFIIDKFKNVHRLCSNINTIRPMEPSILAAGQSAQRTYTPDIFAKIYCLGSGTYTITAVYHSEIDESQARTIASNEQTLEIR